VAESGKIHLEKVKVLQWASIGQWESNEHLMRNREQYQQLSGNSDGCKKVFCMKKIKEDARAWNHFASF